MTEGYKRTRIGELQNKCHIEKRKFIFLVNVKYIKILRSDQQIRRTSSGIKCSRSLRYERTSKVRINCRGFLRDFRILEISCLPKM